MKPYRIFFFIQVLFILLIFLGCNKESGWKEYIPEQLKQYSIFQEGSYWVYKNEITGAIDSSYISSPPDYRYGDPVNNPPLNTYESCEISYGGTFLSHASITTDQYRLDLKKHYLILCLCSYFQIGYTLGGNPSFKNLNYFDSLIVNNKTFYKVMNTQNQELINPGDTITYTNFLAKSIGLIKFRVNRNHKDTTWSILRYHVVQ